MNSVSERYLTGFSGSPSSQDCVVPENNHTPTTEGIENSEGVGGGSKTLEILEGRGGWTINLVSRCLLIQYGFKNPFLPTK